MSQTKKSSIGGKSTCHLLNVKDPAGAKRALRLKFQRTSVRVTSRKNGNESKGSMGLLDINEASVGLFTESLMQKGCKVQLTVEEPKALLVPAVVAWSIPVKGAVPKGNMKFRTGLQFYFENEDQRKALIDFLALLRIDPLEALHIKAPESPVEAPAAPAAVEQAAAETAPATPAATTETPATAPAAEGQDAAPAEASPESSTEVKAA